MSITFEIPKGLQELLQDFTVAVLKERPSDIVHFAASYFNELDGKESSLLPGLSAGVRFNAPNNACSDDYDDNDDDDVMDEEPVRDMRRRFSVAAESYDPEKEDDDDAERVVHPKSDEQRNRLNEAIKHSLLFRNLDEEQLFDVLDAMFERKVETDERVIVQDEDGDNFYVIESGVFDTLVRIDGAEQKVGGYDNQGSFGELALMYNTPRAATIVARSPGILWAMDRVTFRRIVLKKAFQKREMYERLLESVPLLRELNVYERMNVADALSSKTVISDDLIIQQGDPGKEMFFIEDGEVRITRAPRENLERKDGEQEVEINRLTKGSYFGELALIAQQPRAASAYAVGRTKLAVLDVESFERLMGPCLDVMRRNFNTYREQLIDIFGSDTGIPELRGNASV